MLILDVNKGSLLKLINQNATIINMVFYYYSSI